MTITGGAGTALYIAFPRLYPMCSAHRLLS